MPGGRCQGGQFQRAGAGGQCPSPREHKSENPEPPQGEHAKKIISNVDFHSSDKIRFGDKSVMIIKEGQLVVVLLTPHLWVRYVHVFVDVLRTSGLFCLFHLITTNSLEK